MPQLMLRLPPVKLRANAASRHFRPRTGRMPTTCFRLVSGVPYQELAEFQTSDFGYLQGRAPAVDIAT